MNAKNTIVLAALAVGGYCFAGQAEYVDYSDFHSSADRAEVQGELAKVPSQELYAQSEYIEPAAMTSGRSAAEARSGLTQDYANGRLTKNDEFDAVPMLAATRKTSS